MATPEDIAWLRAQRRAGDDIDTQLAEIADTRPVDSRWFIVLGIIAIVGGIALGVGSFWLADALWGYLSS